MKKVELGCGAAKTQGYIGIDKFALPGVDIVADLNKGIPLESDSVDIIYMCHSLEHFDDFIYIMSEVYRVCKDGALVNILSPYQNTDLNIANPYHKIPLNEHTFRFLSRDNYTPLSQEEYYYTSAYNWALSNSDNSNPPFDMRCINIEFYHLKEYRGFSDKEKSLLRRSINNVCEQFYCNLVVVKDGRTLSDEEVAMCKQRVEIENRLYQHPIRLREEEREIYDENARNFVNFIRHNLLNQLENNETISEIKMKTIALEDELKARFLQNEKRVVDIERHWGETENDIQKKYIQLVNDISYLNNELKETKRNLTALKQQLDTVEADIKTEISIADEALMKFQAKHTDTCYELDSIKRSLLDLIRVTEKKSVFFRKKWDFYENLRTIPVHTEFLDGIILKNKKFCKNSVLALTTCIPYDRYVEYLVNGVEGEYFNFFVIAGFNAKLFIEFVQNGQIIKNELLLLKSEGHQKVLLDNLKGSFYVRFRVADNVSTVRLLEIRNRRWGILYRSYIAAYGG